MKKLFLIVSVSILAFSSCNKDNDENQCPATAASLAGSYKLTALKYKANASTPEVDWFAAIDACKKDDIYNLTATMGFSIQDAGTVCVPSGSYDNGAWTLTGNEINMDGFYSGTIVSYDCSNLVLSQADALNPGDKLTATFKKQ